MQLSLSQRNTKCFWTLWAHLCGSASEPRAMKMLDSQNLVHFSHKF
jgi:hypothetical protein